MTIEQFDLTGFTGNQKVEYKGKEYVLYSVDFQEKLLAINYWNDEDELKWVRCENVKLILP